MLSGNRNFEGRINPDVKMNYLASPPLVVAYALAGTMDFDFETEPLGSDESGTDVFLARHLARRRRRGATWSSASITTDMFTNDYADVFAGDERWRSLPTPEGDTFDWDDESTYVRKPPYFDGMQRRAVAGHATSRAPASSPSWATRSRPTTSARPGRSRPTARPASTSPSTASTARTSTPTGPAAATTR